MSIPRGVCNRLTLIYLSGGKSAMASSLQPAVHTIAQRRPSKVHFLLTVQNSRQIQGKSIWKKAEELWSHSNFLKGNTETMKNHLVAELSLRWLVSVISLFFLQIYDIPPTSVKGPALPVPMGEAKALGVYDIPPAKGVSITLFPQDPVFSCLAKDMF